MRNHTIVNLFVMPDNLEYITNQLKDLPVVAKKIGSSFRVQFTCDYVGMRQTHMEIFYYDREEMDHYYVKLGTDVIFRMTIFAKDITPDDYSNEWDEYAIKKAFTEGNTHADSNHFTGDLVSTDTKTIYPRVIN